MFNKIGIALIVAVVGFGVAEITFLHLGVDPMVAPDYNLITWGEAI